MLYISDRRIAFNGAVTEQLADYVCTRIAFYNNQSSEFPIFIVVDNSPGGSVAAGYQIQKAMAASKAPVHVVVKGDSFSTMVKKYGVGVKAIEAANPGVDSTKLKLGQKINIPAAAPKPVKTNGTKGDAAAATDAGGTYTVKSGDNLGSIAKLHGTTVAKLREANGLKTDQIKVGQKLKVPAGGVKKSNEPSAGAVPAPKGDAVLAPPLPLPSSGEPAPAPAPKAPGQL